MEYKPHCEKTGDAQGDYRFTLELPGEKVLLVIGLNPSTANESIPDRTVSKVLKYAPSGGYDGFVMLNLSAERATKPGNLAEVNSEEMHRRNLNEIRAIAHKYPTADVLAAFGNGIGCRKYLKDAFRDIYDILGNGRSWLKIGSLTAWGNPRHPLYCRWELTDFEVDEYVGRL